jgi:outer membrane lipase/esterase
MSLSPLSLSTRGLRAIAATLLCAGLLAACGGSTSTIDKFLPDRVLVFGDELSYITDDGAKYTVNAVSSTDNTTLDCSSSPIWVQYMASSAYGKAFGQCVGSSSDATVYRMSTVNARVDDMDTQITGYMAGSGFQTGDLVTLMVGMHDVLDLYAAYDGTNLDELTSQATAKGQQLGALVNRIIDSGAKVLVSTVPDLGVTPFAISEGINVGDDRPGVLTGLTDALNTGMRLSIVSDGSRVGLLLADDLLRSMVKSPAAYSITDWTDAACLDAFALPTCTTTTVIDAAVDKTSGYLWADKLHPGTAFHNQLGVQAVSRLNTLPF